jgi:hypothetical protein
MKKAILYTTIIGVGDAPPSHLSGSSTQLDPVWKVTRNFYHFPSRENTTFQRGTDDSSCPVSCDAEIRSA